VYDHVVTFIAAMATVYELILMIGQWVMDVLVHRNMNMEKQRNYIARSLVTANLRCYITLQTDAGRVGDRHHITLNNRLFSF